jgi:hypothetical protein
LYNDNKNHIFAQKIKLIYLICAYENF